MLVLPKFLMRLKISNLTLYCQGNKVRCPQFYSFLSIDACVVILLQHPTDRMPGHGVEWNEQISKDWGYRHGCYLSAIDDVAKEIMSIKTG
jgi:hypothetical protein